MNANLSAGVPPGPSAVRILLPREHGAYGQLLFPIATALALGDRARGTFALTLFCVSVFVAHEALLVLLGHRGPRALRESRHAAVAWLIGCGAVAALAGSYGIVRLVPAAREALLLPAGLALVMMLFVVREREHSALGEVAAAAALSSCSVPIALAGGVSGARAATCWLVFALAFIVATLAIHSVVGRVRALRRTGTTPLKGGAAAASAAAALGLSTVAAARGWLPWAVPAALLPTCGLAGILSLFPPHPRRLRSVGWSLVTASALTAFVLTLAFR